MNSWTVEGFPGHGIIPNKTRVIIIYPTVDPHVVVVPIVSSIFLFPIIVLLVICWLRRMAAKRRQRARLAHRDDYWNERSCASIVQRSPPLSISMGNGNGVGRQGTIDLDVELTTTVVALNGEVDRNLTTTQFTLPTSRKMKDEESLETVSHKNVCPSSPEVAASSQEEPPSSSSRVEKEESGISMQEEEESRRKQDHETVSNV